MYGKCKLLRSLRDKIRRQHRLKIKRGPITLKSVTARPMIDDLDSVNKNIPAESLPKKVEHQRENPGSAIMNGFNAPELRDKIVRYLNADDLVSLGQVSTLWQSATERDCRWKSVKPILPTPPNPLKFRDLRRRCPKKLNYLRQRRIMHNWCIRNHQKIKELEYKEGANCDVSEMTSTSDGRLITAYTKDRNIVVWNVTNGKQQMQLTHNESPGGIITWMGVTSDCAILCCVHANWREQSEMAVDQRIYQCDHVRVWDLNTGKCLHVLSNGNPSKIGWMCVKGNCMIYLYKHGLDHHSFAVYDPKEGVCLNTIHYDQIGVLYSSERAWAIKDERIIFNGIYIWTCVNNVIFRWPIDENQPDRTLDITNATITNFPNIRIRNTPSLGMVLIAESATGSVRIEYTDISGFDVVSSEFEDLIKYCKNNRKQTIRLIANIDWKPIVVLSRRQSPKESQMSVCIEKVKSAFDHNVKYLIAIGKGKRTVSLYEYDLCLGKETTKTRLINEFKLGKYMKDWERPQTEYLLSSTFLAMKLTDKSEYRSRIFVVDMNSN